MGHLSLVVLGFAVFHAGASASLLASAPATVGWVTRMRRDRDRCETNPEATAWRDRLMGDGTAAAGCLTLMRRDRDHCAPTRERRGRGHCVTDSGLRDSDRCEADSEAT